MIRDALLYETVRQPAQKKPAKAKVTETTDAQKGEAKGPRKAKEKPVAPPTQQTVQQSAPQPKAPTQENEASEMVQESQPKESAKRRGRGGRGRKKQPAAQEAVPATAEAEPKAKPEPVEETASAEPKEAAQTASASTHGKNRRKKKAKSPAASQPAEQPAAHKQKVTLRGPVVRDAILDEFERVIGYQFQNKELLRQALTHSSYANETKGPPIGQNERLEFLGDSVLSLTVANELYHKYPDFPEGELTRMRSALVCEKTLHILAKEIHLGQYLYLGKGEEATGGRERPSVLADAYEAVIASIYLDGGLDAARWFILTRMHQQMVMHSQDIPRDYKSALQEIVQQNPEERLTYVLADESGPDHNKSFTVEIYLNRNRISSGTAASKKEAEQRAAKEALELMGRR